MKRISLTVNKGGRPKGSGVGRPGHAGPGRPKGSRDKKPRRLLTGAYAKRTRELLEKSLAHLDPEKTKILPLDRMLEIADTYRLWFEQLDDRVKSLRTGRSYLEAAGRWYKACAEYIHPRPLPAQKDVPDQTGETRNVVRAPHPAQSVDSWQSEAEAWRQSQSKIHGSDGNGPQTLQ